MIRPQPHPYARHVNAHVLLLAVASLVCALPVAAQRAGTIEVGGFARYVDFDNTLPMGDDMDIGGRSWFGYLFDRMAGLGAADVRKGGAEWAARSGPERRTDTPGDILHEVMQTRMPPLVVGPVGPGALQYDAVWKVAQPVATVA